ncbi:general stress protein [Paenibacillus tarimensis]|uniref:general stress protein n=1 Tax=Paenibacillus tarimensis TaxID=416012 RepID=UPI001F20C8E2|nr:general stress protein [Paenibacillus tarimensis]MCF2944258.1 general stress protein [Paenibacillus tarimensis]
MAKERKIVGVFDKEDEAVKAIEGLKEQGYRAEEISVIAKDRDELSYVADETGTKAPEGLAAGATAGGVLGGVTGLLAGVGALAIPGVGPIIAAGPIAATLTGAAVGAGAGGLVGGLIGMGIPEEDAERYQNFVEEGRILVLVDADSERDEYAYETFRLNRSLNQDTYDRSTRGSADMGANGTGLGTGLSTGADNGVNTRAEEPFTDNRRNY